MAYLKTVLLNKAEEDLIHDQSVECLKEVGVRVDSESVLDLLAEKGAAVDFKSHIAKIPEKMIDAALEAAPKQITLYGRDSKNDLELPVSAYPYTVTNGTAVFVRDKDTNEYRDCNTKDVADIAKLVDGLAGIDFQWPSLSAKDMPPHTQTLYELWVTLENSSKHFQGDAIHGAHNAEAQIDMAALIAGGREELKKRPIISMIVCPLAPLSFEKGAIESQVAFARAGIPVVSYSMSIGGLSSPVTVAGMMLNTNAENLASLVITQAASEGAPHIYGSDSTPMDMATGNINYDAPELGLVACGLSQMSRRYELPSFNGGFGGFSVAGEYQETIFEALSGCIASICHTDITGGLGCIDDAKGICFRQMLVDAYTWECCREYMKFVEITKERLGLDAIKNVGPRGNFLLEPHTFKYLRKEPILWDKEKFELLTMEKEALFEAAGEMVNRILEEHEVIPVDQSILKKGYDMISDYEKKYAP